MLRQVMNGEDPLNVSRLDCACSDNFKAVSTLTRINARSFLEYPFKLLAMKACHGYLQVKGLGYNKVLLTYCSHIDHHHYSYAVTKMLFF
jgi:hypothetical protein